MKAKIKLTNVNILILAKYPMFLISMLKNSDIDNIINNIINKVMYKIK